MDLLALFLLVSSLAASPTCITADTRVETVIAATASQLQGHEYCEFRMYRTLADVDGDKQNDFVVVFSVEGTGGGGNNSVQYLAVFRSNATWQPVLMQVARRGERTIAAVDIEADGLVRLSTREYLSHDALCCPSGKGELLVRLRGNSLERTTSRPTRR